jgi:hypothetical protein
VNRFLFSLILGLTACFAIWSQAATSQRVLGFSRSIFSADTTEVEFGRFGSEHVRTAPPEIKMAGVGAFCVHTDVSVHTLFDFAKEFQSWLTR